jgi:hypothetical protein
MSMMAHYEWVPGAAHGSSKKRKATRDKKSLTFQYKQEQRLSPRKTLCPVYVITHLPNSTNCKTLRYSTLLTHLSKPVKFFACLPLTFYVTCQTKQKSISTPNIPMTQNMNVHVFQQTLTTSTSMLYNTQLGDDDNGNDDSSSETSPSEFSPSPLFFSKVMSLLPAGLLRLRLIHNLEMLFP